MADLNFTIRTDASSVVENLHKTSDAVADTGKGLSDLAKLADEALTAISDQTASIPAGWKAAAKAQAEYRAETQRAAAAARAAQKAEQQRQAAAAKAFSTKTPSRMSTGGIAAGGMPGMGALGGKFLGTGLAVGAAMAVYGGVKKAGQFFASANEQAAALQMQEEQVRGVAGQRQGDAVIHDLSQWGMKNGQNPTDLLKAVNPMLQAGWQGDDAVKALEAAVVAARGDWTAVGQIVDNFVEMASKGWVEEGALSAIERQGVDIRSALGKMMDMSAEELRQAIQAKKVTIGQVAQALQESTGKGTAAREAFDNALKTQTGAAQKLQVAWGNAMETIGKYMTGPLTRAIEMLTAWINKSKYLWQALGMLAGDAIDTATNTANALIGRNNKAEFLTLPAGAPKQQEAPGETKEEKAAPPVTAMQEAAGSPAVAEQQELQKMLEGNIARYKRLAEAAERNRQEAAGRGLSLAGRRKALEEKYARLDLSGGSEDLDAQLGAFKPELEANQHWKDYETLKSRLKEAGIRHGTLASVHQQLADMRKDPAQQPAASSLMRDFFDLVSATHATAGTDFDTWGEGLKGNAFTLSTPQIRQMEQLAQARDELAALEEQEKALEAIRRQEEERKELVEAQLAGDKERVALLQAASKAENIAKGYMAQGMDEKEARQLAADRVSDEEKLKKLPQAQNDDGGKRMATTPGWITAGASAYGGGNARIRDVDTSMQKTMEKTEKSTADIATTANKIYSYLQSRATSYNAVLA